MTRISCYRPYSNEFVARCMSYIEDNSQTDSGKENGGYPLFCTPLNDRAESMPSLVFSTAHWIVGGKHLYLCSS